MVKSRQVDSANMRILWGNSCLWCIRSHLRLLQSFFLLRLFPNGFHTCETSDRAYKMNKGGCKSELTNNINNGKEWREWKRKKLLILNQDVSIKTFSLSLTGNVITNRCLGSTQLFGWSSFLLLHFFFRSFFIHFRAHGAIVAGMRISIIYLFLFHLIRPFMLRYVLVFCQMVCLFKHISGFAVDVIVFHIIAHSSGHRLPLQANTFTRILNVWHFKFVSCTSCSNDRPRFTFQYKMIDPIDK